VKRSLELFILGMITLGVLAVAATSNIPSLQPAPSQRVTVSVPREAIEGVISGEPYKPGTGVMVPALRIVIRDWDGSVVNEFTKVGDPPTKYFLLSIIHTAWYNLGAITFQNITLMVTNESGGVVSVSTSAPHAACGVTVAGVSPVSMKIALGNGTTPPTIDDFRLASKLVDFPVTFYGFGYNSTHMWIAWKGTYTTPSDITFTEVGLFLNQFLGGYGAGGCNWLLLFRDIIPATTLQTQQTIEVWYYIYVRYA